MKPWFQGNAEICSTYNEEIPVVSGRFIRILKNLKVITNILIQFKKYLY